MDCQVAMNSPVRAKSAVRGPHLDGPGEVWAGLLYFRHAKDDVSTGGELQVGARPARPHPLHAHLQGQGFWTIQYAHYYERPCSFPL